jgi:xanthine dehydrogenase YagR molybdenum-binding subunit
MTAPAMGRERARAEARLKVTGGARYAYEQPLDGIAYGWIVGATVARGTIAAIDTERARAAPGVIAVLTHENARRLQPDVNAELEALQSPDVAFRGQPVALIVAETLEQAREAARLVEVTYDADEHRVVLREDDPRLYEPEKLGDGSPAASFRGTPEAAWSEAPVALEFTYRTPAEHNNAMEPHATTAVWDDGTLTLYDSTQGASTSRDPIASLFDLDGDRVRIRNQHVGGGFGSKGTPRINAVLAAQAAIATGRPIKLAVTRQQMFDLTGYRTPTIQTVRLGAERDGRLRSIAHHAIGQTAATPGFLEQTTVVNRVMYAAPNRRSSQQVAALDVPSPSWFRAPGHCPGAFAIETAMDELAVACDLDPIELRVRNEPEVDPETGTPFSSRGLLECLRVGAERFGWAERDRSPGTRRRGRTLVGTGVAGSTYPASRSPAEAIARVHPDGRFEIAIGATDIGTGARTVLGQVAADALGVDASLVDVQVGDSALPDGPVAGGSAGTASWGSAVHGACRALREKLPADAPAPSSPVEATWDTTDEIEAQGDWSRHAFGAHFAEVEVDVDTGEIRVVRMLGVFACGRILNPRTARSQFVGGLTMGIGMALLEETTTDVAYGDFLNHDLAQYHVPVNADVLDVQATWIDEDDRHLNPMGSKGIGEIGIVGSPAAIGNAVYHAAGVRFRELPLRPDRVLRALQG